MKNLWFFGAMILLLALSCNENGEPQIIDNYECNSSHSVEAIANRWTKTDYKQGEATLDIMAGELCDCFCQINYDTLTKENISARIDKDFMAISKIDDPVIQTFLHMIACRNYLRGDRGGYQEVRDFETVIMRYKERCAGVEARRMNAQNKLRKKVNELNLKGGFFDLIID